MAIEQTEKSMLQIVLVLIDYLEQLHENSYIISATRHDQLQKKKKIN
jgi:hypothetical protein